MTRRISADDRALLRQQVLVSLPSTVTGLHAASGFSFAVLGETLDLLLRAGLITKRRDKYRVIYQRAPGVALPAVRGFEVRAPVERLVAVRVRVAVKAKRSGGGSGVIAGPTYGRGFRWRTIGNLF